MNFPTARAGCRLSMFGGAGAQHVAAAAAAPLPARPSPCMRGGDGAAGRLSSSAPRSWGWRAAFRARCFVCSAAGLAPALGSAGTGSSPLIKFLTRHGPALAAGDAARQRHLHVLQPGGG